LKINDVLESYETEAIFWEDDLGIELPARVDIFESHLIEYANLAQIKLSDDDFALARFLYYHFWFTESSLDFESSIAAAISSFKAALGVSFGFSFGRLQLLLAPENISPRDAKFIAAGIKLKPIFRPIAMALLTEFTRTSRLLLAVRMEMPVSLGDFNMVLAALKLNADELALHRHLIGTVAAGEEQRPTTRCQMGKCPEPASWLVVCPNEDGQEYLCTKHKTENDYSYSTFRIIFSSSCGHHAERRDCRYILVSRDSEGIEFPMFGLADEDDLIQDSTDDIS
jgi:hypothetical protein